MYGKNIKTIGWRHAAFSSRYHIYIYICFVAPPTRITCPAKLLEDDNRGRNSRLRLSIRVAIYPNA